MKTVIFAGGLGSRISEESYLKPKPMIEIGGKPILWHIMKLYQSQGFNEFIICLGYKGYVIKEYFMNYFVHNSDISIDLSTNQLEIHQSNAENIKVTLVETGIETKTAGRLKKIKKYLNEERFMLSYGDGLSDVNLSELNDYHIKHGKTATVTTVQPAGKFGVLESNEEGIVKDFIEKPKADGTWINGGFFVLNYEIFDYLEGDMEEVMWEQEPMKRLVEQGELVAFKHFGFWKAMDILRDKVELENLWKIAAPWKLWK